MVCLVSPVRVKNFLAVGFAVLFARNFGCYKHCINLNMHLLIINRHRPTTLTILLVENAHAMGYNYCAAFLAPDMKDHVWLNMSASLQVIRLNHDRVSLP